MADRRRRVRRPDWPARTVDVARGHLSGRHGRPPRDRCQLVRGGGVLSIPRQGVADGLSLVPRRRIDRRVLGIGFIGDRARQQFRWSGTRAGRPVRQRRAARHLRHGRQRARMAVDTRVPLGRWVAGGAYDEPPYLYLQPDEAPPTDRSATTGFRCMRPVQAGPADDDLRRPLVSDRPSTMRPWSRSATLRTRYSRSNSTTGQRRSRRASRKRIRRIPRGRSSGSRCRPATTTRRLRCSSSCRRTAARRPASSSTCRMRESSWRRSRLRGSIRRRAAFRSTSC